MSQNARIYRSHVVVLSRRDSGEADRLLTLFTPAMGKQEWIAKGIRKPTSRKAEPTRTSGHAVDSVHKPDAVAANSARGRNRSGGQGDRDAR